MGILLFLLFFFLYLMVFLYEIIREYCIIFVGFIKVIILFDRMF